MGRKKIRINGKEFANHGIKHEGGGSDSVVDPDKCVEWAAKARDGGLPEKVDLRPYMTEVEDQAASNSCCANAVAGAYEYLCKRKAMESGDDVGDVSRLFIYYVGRKKDQVMYHKGRKKVKDEGMTIGGAISAIQVKGACLAETFPFDLEKVNDRPPPEAFDQAMDYKVSEAVKIPVDVECMKACLAEGYPIVFGLKLTQRFFSPHRSGYIPTPNPDDPKSAEHGLHAMLVAGYCDRQKLFIIRNSWGTGWGDKGYAYVPYDYIAGPDFNFLGQYAVKGLTNFDLTPDEDDGGDLPEEVDADGDGIPDVEEEEDDDEEDEDEDEDFDPDDMFSPLAEARRAFAKYDLDGSGTINKAELAVCLMANGQFVWPRKLQQYLEKYDTDGSGQICFEEFCAMCGIET